jgi:predicted acyl esterase
MAASPPTVPMARPDATSRISASPIPTLGGRNMLIEGGPRDQRPVQALPNYGLSYRSNVLGQDLTIAGSVDVTLRIQSNCRDTDCVAKLIELHADGRAMLLMDGVVRALYRDAAPDRSTWRRTRSIR